jgi:four helix bundle protein
MFKFEKLDVWHEAIEYTDSIYRVTKPFPSDERFGLTLQLRKASNSIPANVAEGSSRNSSTDFARFVEIAYGSLMETVSHLAVAQKQKFVTDEDHQRIYAHAEKIGRMLSGLLQTLRRN